MTLPEPWRALDFSARAADSGVAVTASESFAVGRAEVPHGVRLCVGAPASRGELQGGLQQLVGILTAGPGLATPLLI